MTGYKLATQQTSTGARAVVVCGSVSYDAAHLIRDEHYASVQNILNDWSHAQLRLEAAIPNPRASAIEIDAATLLCPLPQPPVIYCAGANYRDHAEEMAKIAGKPSGAHRADGARPWFFLKSPRSVAGPNAVLPVSRYGQQIDWEAELVAIIGRRARAVSVENALDCVAGYTCGNDISGRDHVFRTAMPLGSPFRADWTRHKSFDGACPLGPWIVPASQISDPDHLAIRLWVNGELKQDSNTEQMIFSIAEQIADLSAGITLHPGDMIMTGTPAGVGLGKDEFLKPGDVVRVEIDEIGTLENQIA